MKILFLSDHKIENKDLEELIEENTDCVELDISENPLDHISCLSQLKNLKVLDLHDTKISNIDVLTNFRSCLLDLNLSDTLISENGQFKIISTLVNLTTLNLKRMSLDFLNELSTLTKLQTLDLSQCNNYDTIQSISSIVSLTDLNLSEMTLYSIDFIKELKNLQILHLSGTVVHDLSPVALLPHLTKLYLVSTCLDAQELLILKKSKSLTTIITGNDPDLRDTVQHILEFIKIAQLRL